MVTKPINIKVGTKAKYNRYENDSYNNTLVKYENHCFEWNKEKVFMKRGVCYKDCCRETKFCGNVGCAGDRIWNREREHWDKNLKGLIIMYFRECAKISVGGRVMSLPKDIYSLIVQNLPIYDLCGTGTMWVSLRLQTLTCGDYPGLSGWVQSKLISPPQQKTVLGGDKTE